MRFLFLPDGEDPDTLVRQQGPEALRALTEKADALSTYLFRHLSDGLDLSTVDGRARLARLALPYLDKPAGPVYRALLTQELSQLTRLDKESLAQLKPAPRTEPAPAPRAEPAPHSHDQFMPEEYGDAMPPPDDFYPADNSDPADSYSRPPRHPGGSRKGPMTLSERLVPVSYTHLTLPTKA